MIIHKVSPPHDDTAANENESDDEKLGDEVEGPTAGKNEAEKGNAEEEKDKDKKGSQAELEADPISLKYGHLDLYWENGGSLELSSKEGKRALLKPSEIDKSNEKAVAKIPPNALTYEFVLKGMKDDRSYLVRSRARNKSGWGEYSPPIEILTEKMEIDSKILKAGEKEILMGWLPKKYQGRKLKLLFRASKKGFASTAFHAKCDNKGLYLYLCCVYMREREKKRFFLKKKDTLA
ncbi:hypothetical protein RFI_26818 [Reticulomyxa filosa]|uniref:TLDc domain-containing protein n=1 Tax=Reticulomyxa filosa TaxID=46433 RepID=X6M984_RETFI|nr:hypothetical protein RFI_26818 [Reticulomyxa filosa]|eukprot:ETO10563.1 hypothetical protein RFI_26818 [Reticulomyxa filosa]